MPASSNSFPAFAAILTLEEPARVETKEVQRLVRRPTFQFRHIPELDGFRGAAIVCVILGHFLEYHSSSAEIRELARSIAQTGVLLFFVLSGFLITGFLCRERSITGTVHFKQFYIR